MAFQIVTGKLPTKYRVVIYGVEGIGKSTLASRFPRPLFIDTEGSTNTMDVARFPKPTSWQMLMAEVREAMTLHNCETLVIDTLDWAQKLCTEYVLQINNWKSIESPGYGRGYVELYSEFGKLLNLLSDVVAAGITVVLTAHAIIRTVTLPDAQGTFDRYELKLSSSKNGQISSMVKEWADLLLFANYESFVVTDEKSGKAKATGGKRVMYTTHMPAWDAKNRFGLPDKLPMGFEPIAHLFNTPAASSVDAQTRSAEPSTAQPVNQADHRQTAITPQTAENGSIQPAVTSAGYRIGQQGSAQTSVQTAPATDAGTATPGPLDLHDRVITQDDDAAMAHAPKQLADLMKAASVTPKNIVDYALRKKHFPSDKPLTFEMLPENYLNMVASHWDVVMETINDMTLPF